MYYHLNVYHIIFAFFFLFLIDERRIPPHIRAIQRQSV